VGTQCNTFSYPIGQVETGCRGNLLNGQTTCICSQLCWRFRCAPYVHSKISRCLWSAPTLFQLRACFRLVFLTVSLTRRKLCISLWVPGGQFHTPKLGTDKKWHERLSQCRKNADQANKFIIVTDFWYPWRHAIRNHSRHNVTKEWYRIEIGMKSKLTILTGQQWEGLSQ
jgi:hypothetical protein